MNSKTGKTHYFTVNCSNVHHITWQFGDVTENPVLNVQVGDKIVFKFEPIAANYRLGEATIITGSEQGFEQAWPFDGARPVLIENGLTLTLAEFDEKLPGTKKWGLCMVFALVQTSADAKTLFHYIPDPEMQVGSRPAA